MVSRAGLKAPDRGLDVLRFVECELRNRLTFVELRRVVAYRQAEV